MTEYRILVADDRLGSVKERYERLFLNDESFSWDSVDNWEEYRKRLDMGYDALLLDVNLDEWGKTLLDALAEIRSPCPVVLVSSVWHEFRTHERISEALSQAKHVDFIGTLFLKFLGSAEWEEFAASMRSQLKLAIARVRQRGLLTLGESDSVRILHLSDPQYQDPGQDNLAFLLEREIPQFILSELQVPIHFIAITGDITYSGTAAQFEEAKARIEALVRALMPSRDDWRERVLFVPGNHDVDLRVAAANHVKYDFATRSLESSCIAPEAEGPYQMLALQEFRNFVWQLTGNPTARDAKGLCWINDSFVHLGIRFFLLNSAAAIGCSNPSRAVVPSDSLRELVTSYAPGMEKPFGIALSHHGPRVTGSAAIESLENWSQVGKLIQDGGVLLLIHGHGHGRLVHRQKVKTEEHSEASGQLQGGEIVRVMAPTTHLEGRLRLDEDRRGFNLITLERVHGKVEKIVVDSYVLDEDEPHRAEGAPWTVRV